MNEITKEEFEMYEKIRQSNVTNMMDVKRIEMLTDWKLSRTTIQLIMKHYTELKEKFSED